MQFVIWGDPAADVESTDVSDAMGNRLAIATDGQVVFGSGDVCSACSVNIDTAEFIIEDQVRGRIRWTNVAGPDLMIGTSDDGRLPFLVDTEGFIFEVDLSGASVVIRAGTVRLEAPDDPSDDTAFQSASSTPVTGDATVLCTPD